MNIKKKLKYLDYANLALNLKLDIGIVLGSHCICL